MRKLKSVPIFKNENEEFNFWQTHSSVDYVDWSKAKRGVRFPNLKLTSKPVTIRLPVGLVERLKVKANLMDIPYQSLIKKTLFDSLQ
ncbi:BrnA antitoxin family protein [Candidatus Shapirobacteria bacterium]|nr:BrnA antitoxin family protein [Candidatus Shapirobacteria bacterium]